MPAVPPADASLFGVITMALLTAWPPRGAGVRPTMGPWLTFAPSVFDACRSVGDAGNGLEDTDEEGCYEKTGPG